MIDNKNNKNDNNNTSKKDEISYFVSREKRHKIAGHHFICSFLQTNRNTLRHRYVVLLSIFRINNEIYVQNALKNETCRRK